MKNKFVRYSLVALGFVAIGYGSWRVAEYFMGITRLKYVTYKKQEFSEPPTSSNDIEE